MPADVEPAAEPRPLGSDGYWYPEGAAHGSTAQESAAPDGALQDRPPHRSARHGSAVDVLHAVRRFRAADVAMRVRARSDMDMNDSDLVALRHLIAAEERSEPIGPKNLSVFLGISSAATAKLLSRLEASGRLRREPHPSDRRAQVLHATRRAHEQIQRALGAAHQRMMVAAEKLTASEQLAVVRFLDELSGAMDEPAERAHPTEPSQPSEQTHSTEPTHPAEPTHPTDPAHPTEPTHPTEPAHPTDPASSNPPVAASTRLAP